MKYYDDTSFLKLETTRITKFLHEIYTHIDNACVNFETTIPEDEPGISFEAMMASQIIASSFFQFEASDVPHDAVNIICHSYMSPEHTPFNVLNDYLYSFNNQKINPEKVTAVKQLLFKYYSAFYEEYDKNNDPEIINVAMNNFANDLHKIKTFAEPF